jgi:hypothetical protein
MKKPLFHMKEPHQRRTKLRWTLIISTEAKLDCYIDHSFLYILYIVEHTSYNTNKLKEWMNNCVLTVLPSDQWFSHFDSVNLFILRWYGKEILSNVKQHPN